MTDNVPKPGWAEEIPEEQWRVYQPVLAAARERGIPVAAGGAAAVANYTGRWRNTKDLDLYVLPEEHEALVEVTRQVGLEDYYEVKKYAPHWIYRAYTGDVIVDVIWAMANHRTEIDLHWILAGPRIAVRGEVLPIIPAEELIWGKIYVLQPDRSDWMDVLNLVQAVGPDLDWEHLLNRLGSDWPLLQGLLSVFRWLSPARAQELPDWLWNRLHLDGIPVETENDPDLMQRRANLLDTRPWFIPLLNEGDETS